MLDTKEALVQYTTMVMFTCSAKHAAVSAGQVRRGRGYGHCDGGARVLDSFLPSCLQFDFCVWMPNLPSTMQLPPPTSKGQARPEGFIATLPPVNATCDTIIALWMLSKEPGDRVSMEPGIRPGEEAGWGKYVLFILPGPNSTLALRPTHTHLTGVSQ